MKITHSQIFHKNNLTWLQVCILAYIGQVGLIDPGEFTAKSAVTVGSISVTVRTSAVTVRSTAVVVRSATVTVSSTAVTVRSAAMSVRANAAAETVRTVTMTV